MATFEDLIAGAAEPMLRRSVIDPVTGKPYSLPASTGEIVQRASVLPVGRDDAGRLVPAVPSMLMNAAEAAALPGQVARGEFSIFDPRTGHVSDEAIGKAADLAGLAMTGSLPFEAPAGALRIFGGRTARTADHAALDRAAEMQATGTGPDAIWRDTGWGLGRDGIARFEVPDEAARLRPRDGSANTTLGQVLDHPALFEAYPQMRDVQVYHRSELGADAAANPSKNWIALNLDDAQALPALLHESQHIVQRREGFAPGASPIDPALAAHPQVAEVAALRQRLTGLDNPAAEALASRADQAARLEAYRTAAGEVEARNVEARQAMTPAERSAAPPWQTQDTPSARQWLPQSHGVTGDGAQLKIEPADDPLAALEAMLSGIKPEAPPPGPRLLDPNAKSWDLYHGSGAGPDFARFDPSLANNPAERGAVFFAPDAETASGYASGSGAGAPAGPRVFRTTVEPGKTDVFDIGHLAETDPAFNARAREIMSADSPIHGQTFDNYMDNFRASRADDARVMQQMREMGLEPDPNFGTRMSYGHGHIGAAIERAKAQGLDTAILRGLVEHGGDDQVVALTPGRVRSYYSPDHLLYSGGPSGAVPAAVAATAADSPQGRRKMPGIFDDLLATPAPDTSAAVPSSGSAPPPAPGPKPSSATASGKRLGIFDDLLALPPQGDAAKPSTAADVIQSAGAGLIRGAAGFMDLPQNLYGLAEKFVDKTTEGAISALGGTPATREGSTPRIRGLIPSPSDLPKPGETAIHGLEAATGKLYEPQTRAGKFAQAATEFIPGAGKKLGEVIALGVIPGLASEGAGQVTQGSAFETPARIIAPLVTALGGAAFRAPSNVERQVAKRTEGATEAQVDQAEALFQEAASRGLPLTRANALDAVSNGITSLGDLQRFVEGRGRLRGFFAPTADGVRREGQGALDTIAPAGAQPTALGGEVQDAARAAVRQTPEGQALAQAGDAVGPRVTPEEAGQVVQPALQQAYDRREGMRAALGEQDYAAAMRAPETVGVERQVAVERPGDPIVTHAQYSRPRFTDEAPRPLDPPPTVEAEATAAPMSLARFVARNGGIRLDGEAAATDLHRFNVPGLGNVARADGKSIDNFWRERLIEEGYFRPDADGGMARDISSELLRKLQNEQRGVPSYPIGQERAAAAGRTKPGQVQDDYRAALSEAETRLDKDLRAAEIDPETLHPDTRSRVLGAMMRGEESDPLRAYERTVAGMKDPPAPFVKSTAVEETIPDVRFGQANPQPVVDHIDRLLETAKGPAAKALSDARKTLFAPGGRDLDLSVEGLHNARDAINDLIGKAEPSAQRVLMGVRERLDRALSAVPEYEHARSGFEAASRNLDPFAEGTALGRLVARDQKSGRSTMPPERVPDAITEGPTPARAFNEVASPEARQMMEGRLATQVLDTVTGQPGAASAEGIRTALRQHEDLFRQFPTVRDRLQAVASAHDGIERVMASPLGKIANRPQVQEAIQALFPTGAKGVSAEEVGQAVRGMVRNNARAAQDLVRMHVEQVFQDATQRLQSGPNQAGGPKFSQGLVGHAGEGASVEAAIKALPGGEQTWTGIRRLLDIFDAQGARQAIGSGTSFNNAIETDLRAGKPLKEAGAAVMTGGVKLPGRIMDKIDEWRVGKGIDDLAQLFTDPKMGPTFRRLATQPTGSEGLVRLATMALDRAVRGYSTAQRSEAASSPEGQPLKLSVRPRP